MLTGGAFGAEAEGAAAAAADWALCLIERSEVEGLRLDTWLLEERWPGVWLRGTGGARSGADGSWWLSYRGRGVGTSARSEEGEDEGEGPEAAAEEIFWERTIFDLRGDVCLSSLGLAGWSAMVEEPPQRTMSRA